MAFLFAGSLNLVNLGLDESGVLWLDVGLCLLFFIQHSGMVRRPVRQWLAPFIPEEYGSALYAIASGVVLLIVIVFWQESAQTVLAPRGLFQWPFRALYVLPFVGFVWGTRALGSFDPFGFNPIFHRLRGTYPRPMPFIVRGPYSWVRHPLYLFMVLIIWSCPELTTDRLLFNVLWTAWIVAGLYLEERDLIVEYGDTYREYRRRVPMIIPRRVWPGERTKHRQLRRDLS
jgi:protein-S-isoprenylcysteine O-methyltransferase Ste14